MSRCVIHWRAWLVAGLVAWLALRIAHDTSHDDRPRPPADPMAEGFYRVDRVIDASTFQVSPLALQSHAARPFLVKLLGVKPFEPVDTPGATNRQPRPAAVGDDVFASLLFVEQLAGRVYLRFDRIRFNSQGCALVYMFADEPRRESISLNEHLLMRGLADLDTRPGMASSMIRRLQKASERTANRSRLTSTQLP